MHSYLFFLLLSAGVSSYFLPLKEIPHLQKETKHAGIDEILCLLKAENETVEGKFATPCHLENSNCAHSNIEMFIQELQKIANWKCMKEVESRMQNLEKTCNILKKSPPKDEICSKTLRKPFPRFIESLEEFLKWVNHKNCSNAGSIHNGGENAQHTHSPSSYTHPYIRVTPSGQMFAFPYIDLQPFHQENAEKETRLE